MYRLIGRLDKISSMLQLCPSSAILLIEETNKSPFILSYYDRRQYIKPLGIMLKYKKKSYNNILVKKLQQTGKKERRLEEEKDQNVRKPIL